MSCTIYHQCTVTITLNFRPLYYHDISSLKIEETSGFSKKVIRENYDALIDYNQFFYSGKLKLTLPMSREGKIHFEEVKRIFVGIEYLCVITLILSCFLIKRKIRSRNIDFLRSASIITVLLSRNRWYFMCVQLGCRFYFVS